MTRRKPVEITIQLTLNERDQNRMLQNSIERVLNNADNTAMALENGVRNEGTIENASILQQDIEELKPLVCLIWGSIQEALRKARYAQAEFETQA